MVSLRKRKFQEIEVGTQEEPLLLNRLRNQWHFANLCQWIYLFGKVIKIDGSPDIGDVEAECLKPNAPILQDIGLALLKFISSHRGLTHELFDEYTRRQYLARAPDKNPFGTHQTAARFAEFDVLKKIRVLQQMTRWVMLRPERVREKMEEHKNNDQVSWRIEPMGWDKVDRTYFVLDDNRIYRMTDPPFTPLMPKTKFKVGRNCSRYNKRRRTTVASSTCEQDHAANDASGRATSTAAEEDELGGMKWECIAVSLEDVQGIIDSFQKTKDDNEKDLRDQLQEHLLPIHERQEEARKRKEKQRAKDVENLAKMINAKRSSRIANKAEQQRQEEKAQVEAKVTQAERAAAEEEERRRFKLGKERDSRLLSREKRRQNREARRLQQEKKLSQLSEDNRNRNGSGRMSERRLQAEIEKNKLAPAYLGDEEDWIFDCICGVHGQVDDGTHSVACEKCNVWQDSKCLAIGESDAEDAEFHFICQSCRRSEAEAATKPKTTIKLKVYRPLDGKSSPSKQALGEGTPHAPSLQPTVKIPVAKATTARGRGGDQEAVGDQVKAYAQDNSLPTGHGGSRPPGEQNETLSGVPVAAFSGALDKSTRGRVGKGSSPRPTTPKFEHGGEDSTPYELANGSQARASGGDKLRAISGQLEKTPCPADPISPRPGNTSLMATPIISREHGIPGSTLSSFTLPAPEGGLSPTKHSPIPRPQSHNIKTPTLPAVLPPIATLSPSPQEQILTPPIKSTEPVRRPQPPRANPAAD